MTAVTKCARTACDSPDAICEHTQTGLMYCVSCARRINEHNPGLVRRTGSMEMNVKFAKIRPVFAEAKKETERFFHDYIAPEHLLLALTVTHGEMFTRLGIETVRIRRSIEALTQSGPSMATQPTEKPLTPSAKRVLEFAAEEATIQDSNLVLAEHLLVALLNSEDGSVIPSSVLREHGATVAQIRGTFNSKLKAPPFACDHVDKFVQELLALYARNRHFVTLDPPIDFHCHVCSGIQKIPEELLHEKRRELKKEQKKIGREVVVTRLRSVVEAGVPDRSSSTGGRVTVPLSPSVTLWLVQASDDVGNWSETYADEGHKDAFLAGFKAASAMHGDFSPTIVEVQK